MADLSLNIGVGVSELKADLDKSSQAVADAAGQMGRSLKGLDDVSNNASRGFSRLTAAINEARKEKLQETRQVRFLVSEITELIPAANGAKDAIGGLATMLVQGMAGGLGIGVAIEGVKMAIGLWQQHNREVEEAKRKVEELAAAQKQAVQEWWDAQQKASIDSAADALKRAHSLQQELELARQRTEIGRIQLKAEQEITALKAKARAEDRAGHDVTAASIRDIIRLTKQLADLEVKRIRDKEKAAQNEKDNQAQEAELAQWHALVVEAEKATADRIELIRLELTAKLAQIDKMQVASEKQKADLRVKLEEKAAADIAAIQKRENDIKLAKSTAATQQLISDYQQYGAAVGDVITVLMDKEASHEEKTKAILTSITKAVYEAAVKQIMSNAGSAASGAASSQASVPVVGPALAAGAMAAVYALVIGLIGRIGSAEGGADIGGWNPGLMELHKNEMVLPANLAERIRTMTEPVQGSSVTFNVSAVDGKSVARFFKDNEKHLVRVFNDTVKNRRN